MGRKGTFTNRAKQQPQPENMSDEQLLADAERQLQKYLREKGAKVVGNSRQL
jgi:hypothetical protein